MNIVVYLRWVANVVLVIIGGTLFLLCEYDYLPDRRAGFYCEDPALSFIPGDETVPDELLCSIIACVPVLTLVLNEMLKHLGDKGGYSPSKFLKDMNLVYIWLRGYIQSLCGGMFFMQMIKYVAGNPRPTFLTVCAPDKAINCTIGHFIENFKCTNTGYDAHTIVDSSRSFPSGHTMSSVFMGLFLFWYLQRRCGGPWLWAGTLQLMALAWAVLASLSRISDHRHHWWDVLAGSIFGVLMAVYAVKMLCNDFIYESPKPSELFRFIGKKTDTIDNGNKSGEFIVRNNIV